MIAVDTSALMAVILGETQGRACAEALNAEGEVVISAVTMAEARIVALGRSVADVLGRLIGELDLIVVPATDATAVRIQSIYRKWGKGFHPAALNLGDCFAYDVAREHGCGLLYIGRDFAKTDVQGVL